MYYRTRDFPVLQDFPLYIMERGLAFKDIAESWMIG